MVEDSSKVPVYLSDVGLNKNLMSVIGSAMLKKEGCLGAGSEKCSIILT